jgi:hypothetical protein
MIITHWIDDGKNNKTKQSNTWRLKSIPKPADVRSILVCLTAQNISYSSTMLCWPTISLWKESLNGDGHQFYQYQQNKTINNQKPV